jgi:nucleotide-binding universal stress UspA family protein
MPAIHHIVFPTDFSDRSAAVAPAVKAMAAHFGARVTLISVMPPLWPPVAGDPGAAALFDIQQLKKDLDLRLSGAFRRELDGVPVERVAEVGDPAATITDVAHTNGADLIMMATRGHGPFRSLLLGSVTAKVLHDALCPVWTTAHADEPGAAPHVPGKVVLCAVDATPKTVPLMEWAAHYCRKTEADLHLVHVAAPAEAARARETICRQLRAAQVQAPVSITTGEVAPAIREEALRIGADLVVISRGLLHETLGRLRAHSYAIIRQSPCPVLSV